MNPPIVPNDTALEAMLARRAGRARPDGLPASIAQAVAMTPQRRPWPFGKPEGLFLPVPAARTLLILAAGALVAALLGTAAVGSGLFGPPATPAPTPAPVTARLGGPTLIAHGGLIAVNAAEAWAVNVEGVWHFVDGRWEDPTVPDEATWSEPTGLAVDPGRARIAIAAAPGIALLEGGTWAWASQIQSRSVAFGTDGSLWTLGDTSSHAIVRLQEIDGVWRRTVVDCPLGGLLIAVTADGTIWTGGIGFSGTWGLARHDGARCTAVQGLAADIVDLDADARGGLAAAVFVDSPSGSWRQSIMHFDGSAWEALKVDEPVDGWSGDLAVAPSGEVYLLMDGEILRYDAGRGAGDVWQPVPSIGLGTAYELSVAADGSIWYGAPWGIGRIVRAGT